MQQRGTGNMSLAAAIFWFVLAGGIIAVAIFAFGVFIYLLPVLLVIWFINAVDRAARRHRRK